MTPNAIKIICRLCGAPLVRTSDQYYACNAAQLCTHGTRVLVPASIVEQAMLSHFAGGSRDKKVEV